MRCSSVLRDGVEDRKLDPLDRRPGLEKDTSIGRLESHQWLQATCAIDFEGISTAIPLSAETPLKTL